MLERGYYEVATAEDGEQALDLLAPFKPDLVLLDMIMSPGISGLQTFEEILQFHPGQKACIVSGFAESSDVQMVQALGAEGFIKKPYSIEQLGQAVLEGLCGKKASGMRCNQ